MQKLERLHKETDIPTHRVPYNSLEEEQSDYKDLMGLIYLSFFTNRLRYKDEKRGELDRKNEDLNFTNGDKGFLSLCLFEYLKAFDESLLENGSDQIFFELLFSSDLGDLVEVRTIPEVHMKNLEQAKEVKAVAAFINLLPSKVGYREVLWRRYLQYKASLRVNGDLPKELLSDREKRFARMVKACKGISQLLFLANKSNESKQKVFENSNLTKRVFDASYLEFIVDFPRLLEMYTDLCLLVFKEKVAEKIYIEPHLTTQFTEPEFMKTADANERLARILILNFLPDSVNLNEYLSLFGKKEVRHDAGITNEILSFSFLLRIKRIKRYGISPKETYVHTDTVPEHTFFIRVLISYFLRAVMTDERQKDISKLTDVASLSFLSLVHDFGEILRGDKKTQNKTTADSQAEIDSIDTLRKNYVPRKGDLHQRVYDTLHKYEEEKNAEVLEVGPTSFLKAIDIMEALLYIVDMETTDKQVNMSIVDMNAFYLKSKKYFELYPMLDDFFKNFITLWEKGVRSEKDVFIDEK